MPIFSSKFATGDASAPLRGNYDALAIAGSDTVDVPTSTTGPCVGVAVTGAGNVAVQLRGGGTATLTGLSAGQAVDCGIKRVLAAGTTASGLFALYDTQG